MNLRSRIGGAVAALVLGASGGVVVSAGPASAAACGAGTGVTVVVNSSVRCDPSAGGSAASNFNDAGHSLTRTRKFPGFVCRVDGVPASDPCVTASPANAYWALFWADGKGGGWVYSDLGVDSLTVPTGGWVAWVFQSTKSTVYPSITPYTAPAAKPKAPTGGGSGNGASGGSTSGSGSSSGGSSSGGAGSSSGPSPSASASAKARAQKKATEAKKTEAEKKAKAEASSPTAEPSASASAQAAKQAELERTAQKADSSASSTLWIGAALALALLLGMGATIWQRRARRQG